MHRVPSLASCSFISRERVLPNLSEGGALCLGMFGVENAKQCLP